MSPLDYCINIEAIIDKRSNGWYKQFVKPTIQLLFWNVSKATSLVADILAEFQHDIDAILLITACDKEFEVEVNGETVFSKNLLGRHGKEGEIIDLIRRSITKQKIG